ncbi:MAG: cell division protein FtsA, partial [bacterium]|nr:cell division protein FtsA [bacterium]
TDVRTPAYAAGVGLILFAAQGHLASQAQSTGMPITFGRFGTRMKQWFTEAF